MSEGILFYIQKTGSFVGDSILWWKKGSCGYSPDLKDAEMFWQKKAEQICSSPRSDKTMWPVKYIDKRVEHHVDMQDCNHKEALAESNP